jgi:hypothetical protein
MIAEAYNFTITKPNWFEIGVTGAVLVAFLIWWFFFRGKKPN